MRTHLRVARPTDHLTEIMRFYQLGLGFEIVGSFEDHEDFSGVMLGHEGWPYHLEFTHKANHHVGQAPSQDNLLVFYLPDQAEWASAVQHVIDCGYRPVKSFNPYWDERGKTFEDPDGYRVVLQNAAWENSATPYATATFIKRDPSER